MKQVLTFAVLLFGLCGMQGIAQTPAAHEDAPALKYKHQAGNRFSAWYVDRVVYGGEPAFRIRVHHYHAYCNGYLFITPTRIAYVPAFTPEQKDGFSIARSDIASATRRYSGYDFAVPGRTFSFAFLSSEDAHFATGDSDQREAFLNFVALTLSNFAAAHSEFLARLTGQQGGTIAKGTIRVLDPIVPAQGGAVEGSAPVQSVVGIAAAPGGIRAVTVNGFPAQLAPLSNDVVEFHGKPMRLSNLAQGQIAVVATASDNTTGQFAFRVIPAEVKVTDPPPSSRITQPKVTVKGVVAGVHDLRRLDFSGKVVPVSRLTDGTYSFQLADVPLDMGMNWIPGFYEREDGARYPFYTTLYRVPPGPPPLTFDAILDGLRHGITVGRMATLVDQRGVDFELAPDQEKRLRAAGASKALIEAIVAAGGP